MTTQFVPEGICHRCGASIKYIYQFEGQSYGSSCVEVVSGIRPSGWEWTDGQPNYEATKKSQDQKEAERLAFIHNNTILEEQRQAIREANQVKFEELINVLNYASKYQDDFCSNMAETISRDRSTNDLHEILWDSQYDIVREIWGKQTGGRMNSKKYKDAIEIFDTKFDDEL